jgi:hypothetical protein
MSQQRPTEPPVRTLIPGEVLRAFLQMQEQDLFEARETAHVDFKRDPYAMETDRGRQDLAADVAAFASAQDGILVLGVATVQHTTERIEFVTETPGYRPG